MTLKVGALDIAFNSSIPQRLSVSMPELPALSIVIVAYQSRDEIGDCLRSLPTRLTVGAVEILVIDNSPGDGTGALIQREFAHVRYLTAPSNLGFGRANNLGYRECRGSSVLFLNPDTIGNAAALEHCLRRIKQEPDLGLISPRLLQADGTMDLACRRSIPSLWDGFTRASGLAASFPQTAWLAGYNLTHLPVESTYEVGAINGAFMLGPRTAFAAVAVDGAVFDEAFFMYGDDLDLCIRIARAGWRVVYDGRVTFVHLKGLSVAKNYAAMSTAIFDANRDVYLKHFNPGRSGLVATKYRMAFALWKAVARWRARRSGHRKVRPL